MFYEIARDPKVQKRLQDEIDKKSPAGFSHDNDITNCQLLCQQFAICRLLASAVQLNVIDADQVP